ncbi:hypothetical protein CAP35_04465 [Chitinophagaceae bacterium IBVUCB1]|nr:hypothetical protein CAP35_04465 [Chitinophagaceae bacterium IBVUCB1]
MRCFLLISLWAIVSGNIANAQHICMKNGIVYNANDTLCTYTTHGDKKPTLDLNNSFTNSLNIPEPHYFKDYIFKSPSGQPLMYATAKVLSSPRYAYLRYYYKIAFDDADTFLNIPYWNTCINRLMETIVKYKVIESGNINTENLHMLIQYWQNRVNKISYKEIASGHTVNYNLSQYNVEQAESDKDNIITIDGNNIYYNGTVWGTYTRSKKLRSSLLPGSGIGGHYYYIYGNDNKLQGELEIASQYADVWVWPRGVKESMSIYTAERNEAKVLAVAAKFLIVYYNSIANK